MSVILHIEAALYTNPSRLAVLIAWEPSAPPASFEARPRPWEQSWPATRGRGPKYIVPGMCHPCITVVMLQEHLSYGLAAVELSHNVD